jgi:F-type H+-transporting ATPase subunit gamma
VTDTLLELRRKIGGAEELASVVRTMKAMAAASITQYETAVRSLADYHRSVELGLLACLKQQPSHITPEAPTHISPTTAIVFGSDQGLVGQFNDSLAEFALNALAQQSGDTQVWVIGERMHGVLLESGAAIAGSLPTPTSAQSITTLITGLLLKIAALHTPAHPASVWVFHNQPLGNADYQAMQQRLLPLDATWRDALLKLQWPTPLPPQVIDDLAASLLALLREYLFVSLYRACAESLASENASRLAAMQRAEKNINELLDDLGHIYHRQRQDSIDAELFDLVAGFESLARTTR